jgi:heme A synthase
MRDWLTLALIALGVALFAGLWVNFLWATWRAPAGTTPTLNSNAVAVANVFGGILGTAFAVALGINQGEDKNEDVHGSNDAAGVLTTADWSKYLVSLSIIVFFIVGIAALAVWLARIDRAPEAVKNFAMVFVGYAASVLAIALNVPSNVAG